LYILGQKYNSHNLISCLAPGFYNLKLQWNGNGVVYATEGLSAWSDER